MSLNLAVSEVFLRLVYAIITINRLSLYKFTSCSVCLRFHRSRSISKFSINRLNNRTLFNHLRTSEMPYELGFSPRGSETAGTSYGDHKVGRYSSIHALEHMDITSLT